MNWIVSNVVPIAALTMINAAFAAFVATKLYDRFQGNWRRIFANLPTPTLGIASSYGVYAFNEMFAPKAVAVVMAAAYEITYIGIAALEDLDEEQRLRGLWIARSAASISFVQNAIAGLFYFIPGLEPRIRAWDFESLVAFGIIMTILHAAQVWIAYNSANLTLHQPANQADWQAPKQVTYPDPTPVNPDSQPEPEPEQDPLPDAAYPVDNRYDLVVFLREHCGQNGQPLPWRSVAKRLKEEYQIQLSHQSCANIYNKGATVTINGGSHE